jgi:hypothetical protein
MILQKINRVFNAFEPERLQVIPDGVSFRLNAVMFRPHGYCYLHFRPAFPRPAAIPWSLCARPKFRIKCRRLIFPAAYRFARSRNGL